MIDLLFGNAWFVGLIASVIGLLASYLTGKSHGRTDEKIKSQEKEIETKKKELDNIIKIDKVITDVKKEIGAIDDDTVNDRLRDKWTRD